MSSLATLNMFKNRIFLTKRFRSFISYLLPVPQGDSFYLQGQNLVFCISNADTFCYAMHQLGKHFSVNQFV